jgi:hypothetical protein
LPIGHRREVSVETAAAPGFATPTMARRAVRTLVLLVFHRHGLDPAQRAALADRAWTWQPWPAAGGELASSTESGRDAREFPAVPHVERRRRTTTGSGALRSFPVGVS